MKNYKTIIDVRSESEFNQGHINKSINIPLNKITNRLEEIKSMPQPIMLCCLSGGRSDMATNILQQNGIDCFNGGGWKMAEFAIQNGELCLEK